MGDTHMEGRAYLLASASDNEFKMAHPCRSIAYRKEAPEATIPLIL